jgi:hypothetical protein
MCEKTCPIDCNKCDMPDAFAIEYAYDVDPIVDEFFNFDYIDDVGNIFDDEQLTDTICDDMPF